MDHITTTQGSIKSIMPKSRAIVQLKGNIPAFAEIAFTVNNAYVGSIGNYLYIPIAL
jgi:hypothetical protein